ncbi:MAG: glycosyltransferase [Clostridia bacterium]|nr:glycosyltransferase [Clostridia bacterium]
MTKRSKLLYVASTASHLKRFHTPYLEALAKDAEVRTMATGESVDFSIPFDKHFFSVSNLLNIFRIRKILKRERFDSVVLNTTLAAFLVRCAMIGMRRRPYVLNVVHGYLFSKKPRGLKDRVMLWCEKFLWRKTDEIAVMNAEDLEIAREKRLCRGRVTFMHGMGVDGFSEIPVPDADLRAKFAEKDELLCIFVGELSARKNQIFLIRALKRLRDAGIPAKLLLVGEGAERKKFEKEISRLSLENAVFLTGNCEPVTPYLAISDLYVSASRSEGLPFNIMEAMACGLPILASATKGQTDLLEKTEARLYPLDDADAFCSALHEAVAPKDLGVAACTYPSLETYRLSAVFDENKKLLSASLDQERNRS